MKCYLSKLKLTGLLGLTFVLVGVCYFCTTRPELFLRITGWIGVAFFGLGFVVIPAMFYRKGPQVIIDDEGIEDLRLKIGVIRWEDVCSLSIGSVNSSGKFLCIEVTNPEEYLSRIPQWKRLLAKANSAIGFSELTISLSGLNPGLDEVWAYLEGRDRVNSG